MLGADLHKRFLAFAHHDFGLLIVFVFFSIGMYNLVKDTHQRKKGFFDYGLAVVFILFALYVLSIYLKMDIFG